MAKKNEKASVKSQQTKEEATQQQMAFAQNIAALNMMRFAKMQRVQLLDPNANNQSTNSYKKYTRDQILGYLKDPKKNATQIIEASNYLYASSTIYNRLCRYLPDMLTFDYVLAPFKMKELDTETSNIEKYKKAYYKVLNELEIINVKQTFGNVAHTAMREGAFFGIEVLNKDSYMIYQLPYNKCKVSSWEDGCPLFSLDMSFFDRNLVLLESIGGEIQTAYNSYQNDKKLKWFELDGKYSICILADETLDYIVPPLAGAFTDLYLIEDYKDLMKSKEIINLYKLISLKYPIDDEGNLLMDEQVATTYYNQIASQLDSTIAVALNPFEMKEVSFDSNKSDSDGTLKAQRDLFSNVGISNLIFNNEKGSSNALLKSITNDFTFIAPILRSLERWLNKKLKLMSGSTKFKTIFLDVTHYDREDVADRLRKDMQYGIPNKSALCAVGSGYSPSDTVGMAFLENEVLGLGDMFVVPKSANTQGVSESGRPKSEEPLEETGIQTDESGSNDGRV